MLEGCGRVLLEEKVAYPGERIAGGEAAEQPRWVTGKQRKRQLQEPDRGADDMQAARGPVGVFAQIERIKLVNQLKQILYT